MTDGTYDDIVERELFLICLADGIPEDLAGYEVNWTPAKVRRVLAEPDFAEMVDAAKSRADGTIEAALHKLGRNGNLGAIQMWLYNRNPERWKDVRRIEVKNELNVNLSLVASTKQAVLEMLREVGPAALQPSYDDDDGIIDIEEVVDDSGE